MEGYNTKMIKGRLKTFLPQKCTNPSNMKPDCYFLAFKSSIIDVCDLVEKRNCPLSDNISACGYLRNQA